MVSLIATVLTTIVAALVAQAHPLKSDTISARGPMGIGGYAGLAGAGGVLGYEWEKHKNELTGSSQPAANEPSS
jgi:hypothetical protein